MTRTSFSAPPSQAGPRRKLVVKIGPCAVRFRAEEVQRFEAKLLPRNEEVR